MTMTFSSNLNAVNAMIDRESRVRINDAQDALRNAWLNRLSGERSGRTYKIPGTNRTYVASAPGEAPASRLGDLRRSVDKSPVERIDGEYAGSVGSPLDKSVMLELGTRRMGARPSLQPAIEDAREEIHKILSERWA
jgi:hypothetical protein